MPSPAPLNPSRWPTAMAAIVTGLLMLGLYFAFTVNVGVREIVAGVLSAAIATIGAFVFAHHSNVHYRPRVRDLMQAWRIPWYAVSDTGQVLRSLAQQLFTRKGAPSLLLATPFDVGPPLDPAEAGRRALAVFYTTLTPNSVVIGVFPQERLLLFHQAQPSDVVTMTQNLGARP